MPWLSGSSRSEEARDDSTSCHSSEKNEQKHAPSPAESSSASNSASSTTPAIPNNNNKPTDWNSILNATDRLQFTEPRNVISTVLLASGILFVVYVHRRYLRRFPEATDISPWYFRKRSLLGQVTSVGDGDNFRMYHTPGGRLMGWGWLRKIPTSKKELKARTVRSSFLLSLFSSSACNRTRHAETST